MAVNQRKPAMLKGSRKANAKLLQDKKREILNVEDINQRGCDDAWCMQHTGRHPVIKIMPQSESTEEVKHKTHCDSRREVMAASARRRDAVS